MRVPPGLPQNQEGLLVDLVEGTQKDGGMVASFLSLERSLVLFSEKPEANPSTGGFGGGPLSSGLSGGSSSVRGRVPTKSWE